MKWIPYTSTISTCVLASLPIMTHASIYLTPIQAQQLMFPASTLQQINIALSPEAQISFKKMYGINRAINTSQIYKVVGSGANTSKPLGWFIIDKVLGKHELITYAVGLNASGSIKQIEILEYNESYGGQVRNVSWRKQFVGKTAQDALTDAMSLNREISNISGATLSCKHLTDGVKRLLALYDTVLKGL